MRRVIIESPFAGDVRRNIAYARSALRDSLKRGEAPIASHLLYTQEGVLDDNDPAERQHGIDAGLAWGAVADATIVYEDLGISQGMRHGIDRAIFDPRVVEFRRIVLPEFHDEVVGTVEGERFRDADPEVAHHVRRLLEVGLLPVGVAKRILKRSGAKG